MWSHQIIVKTNLYKWTVINIRLSILVGKHNIVFVQVWIQFAFQAITLLFPFLIFKTEWLLSDTFCHIFWTRRRKWSHSCAALALCLRLFLHFAELQITFKNMSGLMFFYWQWCSKFRRVWWPNKLTILFHPILLIILLFFFPVSQSCLMANTSRDVMWVFSASINLWLVRLPGSCTAVSPIAAPSGGAAVFRALKEVLYLLTWPVLLRKLFTTKIGKVLLP